MVKHGKTAQFWVGYINLIHLYHEFIRSIREGDFELYVYCLPRIANMFFTFNQPNYARWTVRYHDNLLKLEETHPAVFQNFKRGLFSIKRTKKPFSRSPIDLTLEQTINADAASQKTGISYITNSLSARQRWTESHFLRTTIITDVMEDLSLTKKEDVTQDLQPSKIRKNNNYLTKIVEAIKETMNPFDPNIDKDALYNIGTGKSVSSQTSEFLLNVLCIGSTAQTSFVRECIENPKRFEESIKRQKIHTFATEAGKRSVKGADNKVKAVTMIRDLFGSILYLSLQRKIDMAVVLQYPLTPVPLSLSHIDGVMLKTPKVTLLKHFESSVQTVPPTVIHTTIIDAMFFLHLQSNLPETFGAVSRYIFKAICSTNSKTIHFVFDKTISPSIKDCERDSRTTNRKMAMYHIIGPCQKRPANWLEALRNDEFKEALVNFLISSWNDDSLASVLQGKVLFSNCGDICFSYRVRDGKLIRREELELYCTHEEADSRMIYHLISVPTPNNVVIRTADTDVLIIAIGCLASIDPNINIWLEVGLFTKNTLRYISVNQLYSKLGARLSKSLPSYHAFTGCDYTAAFSRKGKILQTYLRRT